MAPSRRRPVSPSTALDAFLSSLVGEGAETALFRAVVGWVGTSQGPVWTGAAGRLHPGGDAPVTLATRFDLASLTKPFTASLALRLDGLGLLPLGLALSEIWPGRVPLALLYCTLEDLLRHRSFLAAWAPLYHRCREPREILDLLLSAEPPAVRRGTYSDLGYILWGLAAEELLGRPLDEILREHLLEPLGLGGVVPSPGPAGDVAASTLDTAKEVELARRQGLAVATLPAPEPGRVQDGNARFLGGFGAHAGLFANAGHLVRLAAEWLHPDKVLAAAAVAQALADPPGFPTGLREARAVGWERRRTKGSAGPALSAAAFGHPGFAGGSLWADPEGERIFVLLGHRRSPFSDLDQARRRFHRLGCGLLRTGG